MKLAYLILAHNDPNHLKRLITKLDSKNVIFIIHIDSKSNIEQFQSIIFGDNKFFLRDRISISWAGFSMVEAMLMLINNALSSGFNFSHYIFLSGNDYPVWTADEIETFFFSNNRVEFIRAYDVTSSGCEHCLEKINRNWFFDLRIKNNFVKKIVRTILNSIPQLHKKNEYLDIDGKKNDVMFGSQWFAITPECAIYVIREIEVHPEIIEYFKHTLAPDEMFFHTIIFNSEFLSNTLYNKIEKYSPEWKWNNYTYLDTSNMGCNSSLNHRKTVKYICEAIVRNLKNNDLGSLQYLNELAYETIISENLPFIRKVNTEYSNKLLDLIDENRGV